MEENCVVTPAEAKLRALDLMNAVGLIGKSCLTGNDLIDYEGCVNAIVATSSSPASPELCLEIEANLAGMIDKLLDSSAFLSKPRHEVQLVIDCFEIAGSSCQIAAQGVPH